MIRVLVVEDSPTARDLLVWILQNDPEIQVVGMARDGLEAVRLAGRLEPDVIVMDIHMPGMDGFEASRQIMQRTPTPIVVVSASMSPQDLLTTFESLRVGALTAVEKPTGPSNPDYEQARDRLVTTVKLMAEVKVVRHWGEDTLRPRQPLPCPVQKSAGNGRIEVVALAASTGGPAALHRLLGSLPADLPVPILVVQHLNPGFAQGLVDWLDRTTALRVKTAQQGEKLVPGCAFFAPDNRHLLVRPGGWVRLRSKTKGNGLCPSADLLFASVAGAFGAGALGVILTGMGRDGVEGLRQLKSAGGRVLAQDESSAVVFGMPCEAIAAGIVDRVVSLGQMAQAILEMI